MEVGTGVRGVDCDLRRGRAACRLSTARGELEWYDAGERKHSGGEDSEDDGECLRRIS